MVTVLIEAFILLESIAKINHCSTKIILNEIQFNSFLFSSVYQYAGLLVRGQL